jgi:hypothetical protein
MTAFIRRLQIRPLSFREFRDKPTGERRQAIPFAVNQHVFVDFRIVRALPLNERVPF